MDEKEQLRARNARRRQVVEATLWAAQHGHDMVDLLRGAANRDEAVDRLIASPHGWTEFQAQHMVDVPFARLSATAIAGMEDELARLARGEDTAGGPAPIDVVTSVATRAAGDDVKRVRRVAIYPDWNAPPIWLLTEDGQEDGNALNLVRGSPLAAELRGWGRRWAEALDDDGQTTSDDSEAALLDELRSLAAKVQDHLGPTFIVELRLPGS